MTNNWIVWETELWQTIDRIQCSVWINWIEHKQFDRIQLYLTELSANQCHLFNTIQFGKLTQLCQTVWHNSFWYKLNCFKSWTIQFDKSVWLNSVSKQFRSIQFAHSLAVWNNCLAQFKLNCVTNWIVWHNSVKCLTHFSLNLSLVWNNSNANELFGKLKLCQTLTQLFDLTELFETIQFDRIQTVWDNSIVSNSIELCSVWINQFSLTEVCQTELCQTELWQTELCQTEMCQTKLICVKLNCVKLNLIVSNWNPSNWIVPNWIVSNWIERKCIVFNWIEPNWFASNWIVPNWIV